MFHGQGGMSVDLSSQNWLGDNDTTATRASEDIGKDERFLAHPIHHMQILGACQCACLNPARLQGVVWLG